MGTWLYVAPEMLDKRTLSGAFSDFWALGVILFEMACGVTPFIGKNENVVFDNILRQNFAWPDHLQDHNLKDLINQLLKKRPEERLGMGGHDALKAHPFFDGVDWDRVRRQEDPVPAYNVQVDPNDPSKIVSFSLSPEGEPLTQPVRGHERVSTKEPQGDAHGRPDSTHTDQT